MKKIVLCVFVILILLFITSSVVYSKTVPFTYEYDFDHTNSIIFNITPNKSVVDFKNNFTYRGELKNITVYNNNKELMETNMKVKYANKELTVSVIGDLNCDGLCNIVDLSLLVRSYIGQSGYVITDEVVKKSADIDRNEIINITDISRMLKYIVKGKLSQTDISKNAKVSLEEINGDVYYNDYKEINIINPAFGRIIISSIDEDMVDVMLGNGNKVLNVYGKKLGTTQIKLKCEKTLEAEESEVIYYANIVKAPGRNAINVRNTNGTSFIGDIENVITPLMYNLIIENTEMNKIDLTIENLEIAEIINETNTSKTIKGKKAGTTRIRCKCYSGEFFEEDEFYINVTFTN